MASGMEAIGLSRVEQCWTVLFARATEKETVSHYSQIKDLIAHSVQQNRLKLRISLNVSLSN